MNELLFDLVHNHLRWVGVGGGRIVFVSVEYF